ncbi:4-hydroxy-tetrahydrodipicolinate synthase [Undibacterium sp. TJN19]|uniref:4-hydroxy-tetrahydrodipicolinate synthase n=1 Tax=Undibacterium sp. TJN19 TaxID=3413055 RepID=UPI003BF3F124
MTVTAGSSNFNDNLNNNLSTNTCHSIRTDFSGIWVAIVTPFTHEMHDIHGTPGDAALDLPALKSLASQLIATGVAGLVVCGSTGEAASLSHEEQMQVLDAVLEVVPASQVIMGLCSNNMQNVMHRLHVIAERKIAAVLVTAPYYIRPSQAGVIDYFHTIANASAVPIVLYNIPYRTGVNMELPSLQQLARHPNIVAIKDCGGDQQATMQLIIDADIQVLAGEDQQVFNTLCLGGAGAIIASAHIRPDLFLRMHEQIRAGQLGEARTIFYHLLPVMQALFEEPNPAPLKAVLASTHAMHNVLRPPMQLATAAMQDKMQGVLERLQSLP